MRTILCILLLGFLTAGLAPTPATADGLPGLSIPEPTIAESTLIQGTGWSLGRSRNESLACEVAHNRAMAQLSKGLEVAQSKRLVTVEELAHALPITIFRSWDHKAGRCTVRMRIEIPVQSKSSLAVSHDQLY